MLSLNWFQRFLPVPLLRPLLPPLDGGAAFPVSIASPDRLRPRPGRQLCGLEAGQDLPRDGPPREQHGLSHV